MCTPQSYYSPARLAQLPLTHSLYSLTHLLTYSPTYYLLTYFGEAAAETFEQLRAHTFTKFVASKYYAGVQERTTPRLPQSD